MTAPRRTSDILLLVIGVLLTALCTMIVTSSNNNSREIEAIKNQQVEFMKALLSTQGDLKQLTETTNRILSDILKTQDHTNNWQQQISGTMQTFISEQIRQQEAIKALNRANGINNTLTVTK